MSLESESTATIPSAQSALEPQSSQTRAGSCLLEPEGQTPAPEAHHDNSCAKANLPPEILWEIFLMVAYAYRAKARLAKDKFYWIWMSHVCSHWRTAALECLGLWSDIFIVNPAFTQLMLARSKGAPIAVTFTPFRQDGPRMRDIVREVLSQIERIRSISIEGSPGEGLELTSLLAECTGAAPLLENLTIICGEKLDPSFKFTIPSQFLAGRAPILKTVHLLAHGVPGWGTLPLPSSLTSLRLASSSPNPGLPSWGDLRQTLHRMPLLQELQLSNFLPETGEHVSGPIPTPSVTLPRLVTLKLLDTWTPAIIKFIETFLLPRMSDVDITFLDSRTPFNLFLVQLKITQNLPAFGPVRELRIHAPTDYESTFLLGFSDTNLSLRFRGFGYDKLDDRLLKIRGEMDLHSLSFVEVIGEEVLRKETWTSVFAPLPKLSHVAFNDYDGEFVQALRVANDSGGFPALSHVTIRGLDFAEDSLPFPLITLLNERPASAPRVTVFLETGVNLGQGEYDLLVNLAPKVAFVWDGHEDFDPLTSTDDDEGSSEQDSDSDY